MSGFEIQFYVSFMFLLSTFSVLLEISHNFVALIKYPFYGTGAPALEVIIV